MDDFDFADGSEAAQPDAEGQAEDMGLATPVPASSASPVPVQTHVDSSGARSSCASRGCD